MKFLLDANLSPLVARHLAHEGHQVEHVRELGLRDASDEEIMDFAANQGWIILSQDSDFTN